MLHPKGDGIVAAVRLGIFLGKSQDGHVVVLRADEIAAVAHHPVVAFGDGAALDHIKRVAEGCLVVRAAQEVLEVPPDALLVEACQLRMYVAEVKGLSVGFFRVETVGTAQYVPALIAASRVITRFCADGFGEHGVWLEGVARTAIAVERLAVPPSASVPVLVVRREACIPLERRPAVCLEPCVVADAEVQGAVGKSMDDERVGRACRERRNLHAVDGAVPDLSRRSGFGIEELRRDGVPVVVGLLRRIV